MKNIVRKSLQSLLLVPAVVLGLSMAVPAVAGAVGCTGGVNGGLQGGANCAQGTGQATDLFGTNGIFKTITNVLLYIIGAIAVIMLIIGGVRYVTSNGESANVTAAKNTILYAVVGIIVAILAYAVVNFVIGSFTSPGGGGA